MNIKISKAHFDDLKDIERLERRNFSSPWSLSTLTRELSNKSSLFYTLKSDNILLGYLIAWHLEDFLELQRIAINPDYQRNGFGRALLEFLEKIAEKNSCIKIILEVNSNNTIAYQLYSRFSYKKTAIRKNYYADGDAILMEKDLTHSC